MSLGTEQYKWSNTMEVSQHMSTETKARGGNNLGTRLMYTVASINVCVHVTKYDDKTSQRRAYSIV